MGYLSIENLYRNDQILQFKEVYALEKVDGTSCHIHWDGQNVKYFSGGAKYDSFIRLFDDVAIKTAFQEKGLSPVTIYGEGYGGKIQGMSKRYGPELKFVAFDVKVDDNWLQVEQAERFVQSFGLEFVAYSKISTNINVINFYRDAYSVQAMRNGMGDNHHMEGIILRPLFECTLNNGDRLIAKHKRPEERETKTQRDDIGLDKQTMLKNADLIAEEWVTYNRLVHHILAKIEEPFGIEKTGFVIKSMVEDIEKESVGEIIWTREAKAAIGKKTASMFHKYLEDRLLE